MNRRANNLLLTCYWQHTHALYDDVSNDRIQVSSISHVPGSTSAAVGSMGPFGPIQDRVHVLPFALARAMMQNDTSVPRDVHPRPRFTYQSPDPVSRGGDVQNKGLERLRRVVYNPRVQGCSLYSNSSGKSQEKEDGNGKRCAVCLDDFEAREMVTLTPCHHMFHEKCIVPWVKSRGQCPVCRFVIGEGSKERERSRTSSNVELGNDPFA